jgi:hypothetical protein
MKAEEYIRRISQRSFPQAVRDTPKIYIRVQHLRRGHFAGGTSSELRTKEAWKRLGIKVESKGGLTRCFILSDAGGVVRELARGEARCSREDNFSKKLGRTIAGGRAMKDLERRAAMGKIAERFVLEHNESAHV